MRTLPQIARAAIVNAQAGLKFEKDRFKVHRDALHDADDLGKLLAASRLAAVTGLLLRATKLAFEPREIDPGAKLALAGLCDWVEAEMAMIDQPAELG